MKRAKLDVIRVNVVRDPSIRWEHETRYTAPAQVADAARAFLGATDRENFLTLFLDGKNHISCINHVSMGSLNQSLVHPREVFKAAILANAAAIILIHNHPSGDASPSSEDLSITRKLSEAGEIIGIHILDHVIIADGTEDFLSFRERGLL